MDGSGDRWKQRKEQRDSSLVCLKPEVRFSTETLHALLMPLLSSGSYVDLAAKLTHHLGCIPSLGLFNAGLYNPV